MKKSTALLLFTALLAAALFAACEWNPSTGLGSGGLKYFDSELQGTWHTNTPASPEGYVGSLEIGYDSIKITGYDGALDRGANANTRPFDGYTKGVFLTGYSVEKTDQPEGLVYPAYDGDIYIATQGAWKEAISFRYYREGNYPYQHFLRFTFNGRDQILQKAEEAE